MAKSDTPAPEAPKTEADLRRQAVNEGLRDLRDAHLDEFNSLVAARAEALGVSWAPRKTKAERAREKALAALAEAGLTPADLQV